MTVGPITQPVQYAGNGSATTFNFPGLITASSDLVVGFIVSGVYSIQSGGYSIPAAGLNNAGGCQVIFTTAPPLGTTIDLRTLIPETQPTNFGNLGPFSPESNTAAVDRAVRLIQDLYRLTYLFGVHGPDQESVPWSALPGPAARAGTQLGFDSNGLPALVTSPATVFTQALFNAFLGTSDLFAMFYPQSTAEQAAGITPTFSNYPPLDVRRYGALFNAAQDDTAAINAAISVASQVVNGAGPLQAMGATITCPTGVSIISSEITLPNRVILKGQNKRGTIFRASTSTWNSGTSPWMFHAVNGTSSMFDSRLESCAVDANGIAGLGCILSDAWQDGCGTRSVLLINFTTSGIKFQNGYGGADTCLMVDTEIFGNTLGSGTANSIGIDLSTAIGSSAGFKVDLRDVVIAGGVQALVKGVACAGNSVTGRAVHMEGCTSCFYLDGNCFATLEDCDGSSSTPVDVSVVTLASTFTGTLVMTNCRRNGNINFINDLRSGGLGTISGLDSALVIQGNNGTPPIMAGGMWSAGYFNGTTTGTNPPTAGFNTTSITRNSAGNYTVLEATQRPSSACAPMASCNLVSSTIQVEIVNSQEFLIIISVAGTPTDTSEIHYANVRLQ
jgi:hypothetical protein